MDEKNNINKYRQKKKRRSFLLKLGIFLLIILIAALVIINREALFAPLKDAALKTGKGGFPILLPGSTQYTLGEMGDNLFLLTDTYLYTYNGGGAQIAGIQHGFQNPEADSNNKRTLVYDRGGKSFKLFSRTAEIYKNSVDDTIVFGKIGNSERAAVVTTSVRYSNLLYVYNSEGKQIFRWASPEEKIMGLAFGKNDNSVYVSALGEKNGEFCSYVIKFDLSVNGEEKEVWRASAGNSIPYYLEWDGDGVYSVTSSGAFLFSDDTGEVAANTVFTRKIYGIPEKDGIRVIMFRDSASNGEAAVVYNSDLEEQNVLILDNTTDYDIKDSKIYILNKDKLSVYNSVLEGIRTYELDDEYSNVKIIGNSAYLLGYNTVQRVSL